MSTLGTNSMREGLQREFQELWARDGKEVEERFDRLGRKIENVYLKSLAWRVREGLMAEEEARRRVGDMRHIWEEYERGKLEARHLRQKGG